MQLIFYKLRKDAKLPTRKYEFDAGLDIYTPVEVKIPPGDQAVIMTGLALAHAPKDVVIQVWPKSGLDARLCAHTGAGIIDSGYRGEILILIKNTSKKYWLIFEPGDAIAQLVVVPCEHPEVCETTIKPPATDRGASGGIAYLLDMEEQ